MFWYASSRLCFCDYNGSNRTPTYYVTLKNLADNIFYHSHLIKNENIDRTVNIVQKNGQYDLNRTVNLDIKNGHFDRTKMTVRNG